jgi:hypothetical protein
MESILEPIERSRLVKMLSNDSWMDSDMDKEWAARLLLDFGYIHTPKEVAYFCDYPQRREPQLREILEI